MPPLVWRGGWEVGSFVDPLVLLMQRLILDTLGILNILFLGTLVVLLWFSPGP